MEQATHMQIEGPMLAGKTTEEMRLVGLWRSIGKRVGVYTHVKDQRGGGVASVLWTHNGQTMPCVRLESLTCDPHTPLATIFQDDVIVVDEGQLFDDLLEFVRKALAAGKHTIVAGLTGRADQKPFGQMHMVRPYAQEVKFIESMCQICRDGTKAQFTIMKGNGCIPTSGVLIGGHETYMPVCQRHLAATGILKD
jgi:thymidine kinase